MNQRKNFLTILFIISLLSLIINHAPPRIQDDINYYLTWVEDYGKGNVNVIPIRYILTVKILSWLGLKNFKFLITTGIIIFGIILTRLLHENWESSLHYVIIFSLLSRFHNHYITGITLSQDLFTVGFLIFLILLMNKYTSIIALLIVPILNKLHRINPFSTVKIFNPIKYLALMAFQYLRYAPLQLIGMSILLIGKTKIKIKHYVIWIFIILLMLSDFIITVINQDYGLRIITLWSLLILIMSVGTLTKLKNKQLYLMYVLMLIERVLVSITFGAV